MSESFLERVETSYNNSRSQELCRVLEMRIGELAPGALPDLSDLRDVAVANVIRLTSPIVLLIVLGKEGAIEVVNRVRRRFQKVDIQSQSIQERAQEFWDTDLPSKSGVDPNYYQDGINTHEKYIL